MAETPPYRRLGAQPDSPTPKGRRPVLYSSMTMDILGILDKWDNQEYL